MKNYFIIHGSFGNSKEHYLPWLKKQLEKKGEVFCFDFPIGVDRQNFKNWSKILDEYKNKITNETIFIGRSIAPVFIVKYILQNKLKIKKLISVSGFNNYFTDGGDFDKVNETMFVKNLKTFKNYCEQTVCIYSENDPYVKLKALKIFDKSIADVSLIIKKGGHFNSESGYGKIFKELLYFIDE